MQEVPKAMPATEVSASWSYLGQVHPEAPSFLTHWSLFAKRIKKENYFSPVVHLAFCHPFILLFVLLLPFFLHFSYNCPTISLLVYYSNTPVYILISSLFLPHWISSLPSYYQMHFLKFKSEQFISFLKKLFLFLASYFSQGEIDWCSINTFIMESQYASRMHLRPISPVYALLF